MIRWRLSHDCDAWLVVYDICGLCEYLLQNSVCEGAEGYYQSLEDSGGLVNVQEEEPVSVTVPEESGATRVAEEKVVVAATVTRVEDSGEEPVEGAGVVWQQGVGEGDACVRGENTKRGVLSFGELSRDGAGEVGDSIAEGGSVNGGGRGDGGDGGECLEGIGETQKGA